MAPVEPTSTTEEAKTATILDHEQAMVWQKALLTKKTLREDLAWYKCMPKDVLNSKTLKNLIKLLMRINKLFIAKANAAKILKALLCLKIDLR